MKLFEGVVFSKPGVMKNKDHMIMNMIKVPQNIRFNYEKNKMIHCQEFKV